MAPPAPGALAVSHDRVKWDDEPVRLPDDLLFANGLGGFTPDGRDYCLLIGSHQPPHQSGNGQPKPPSPLIRGWPPAPWCNVVANPVFGFIVSESGSGYTWSENSQTNRLTPWSNDPVSDPPGEVVYLRDEDTGEIWCPTPLPIPSPEPTLVRHGQGYTSFEQNAHGLCQELTLYVPPDDAVKLIRLRVKNMSERPRKLSATFYAAWVLGTSATIPQCMSSPRSIPPPARSWRAMPFAPTSAPAWPSRTSTGGPGRSLPTAPSFWAAWLTPGTGGAARVGLSGSTGETLDPCAAIQTAFDLEPGAEIQIVFLLGEAEGIDAARNLVRDLFPGWTVPPHVDDVRGRWDSLLETIQVHTPEPALDLLINRWLLYQVLSCRVWGRSAFYQSGGAYGFRDQLQDVMALVHAAPQEARAHILRAAGRQFPEGDVQHWWHPPAGRGIRTRIADDPLWLPFVTAHYVTTTGDLAILDEPIPFLQAPPLRPDQDDDYGLPAKSTESTSLYDHCVRSVEWARRLGVHGLPLMDHGDWNDGMNKVGAKGKGESVWLAWFHIACFTQFAQIAESRNDSARAANWRQRADALRSASERTAWDGDWYRRAYFDDGTPLGSAQNDACAIDSIAQTWGVISGAASPARASQAMKAVDARLVRHDDRLILLFDPPFDKTSLDPGYVKGYIPGVRENGGQYTHAAVWVVEAAALLGQGDHALELARILNPILHAQDPEGVERYKVEPYVLAGDVYSRSPHTGRGGWTWYTGSAGWYYQATLESILGFRRDGDRLTLRPCVPPEWSRFEITYRFRSATYAIRVEMTKTLESESLGVWLDDKLLPGDSFTLADDSSSHRVRVVVGHS